MIRQVLPPAPSIISLKPASGVNTGDKKVTITGVNLTGVTGVRFGSHAALRFTAAPSGKKVVAYTPASTVGSVVVRVVTTRGTAAVGPADRYTYVAAAARKGAHPHATRRTRRG